MATMGIIGYSNKSSYIIYCGYCINLFRICTKLFCAIEKVEKCSNIYRHLYQMIIFPT